MKAAADTVLSLILYLHLSLTVNLPSKSDVRNNVCLPSAVVANGETLVGRAITVRWTAHSGWNGKMKALARPLFFKPILGRQLNHPSPGLFGRISRVWDTIRGKIRVKTEYALDQRKKILNYSNGYGMQISQVQSLRRALVLLVEHLMIAHQHLVTNRASIKKNEPFLVLS